MTFLYARYLWGSTKQCSKSVQMCVAAVTVQTFVEAVSLSACCSVCRKGQLPAPGVLATSYSVGMCSYCCDRIIAPLTEDVNCLLVKAYAQKIGV